MGAGEMHIRADAAMERYAAGDDAAFGAVYDAVAPLVYAYAVRALADHARAEDVVQHTLLKMHRARGHFIRGAPVMPWAYTIARRLVVDGIRRRRRDDRLCAETLIVENDRAEFGPDEHAAAAEAATALRGAFAELPAAQRTAYAMVHADGMSLAEVASAERTTVTAVKLRVHRAVERLRAAVGARPKEKMKRS